MCTFIELGLGGHIEIEFGSFDAEWTSFIPLQFMVTVCKASERNCDCVIGNH